MQSDRTETERESPASRERTIGRRWVLRALGATAVGAGIVSKTRAAVGRDRSDSEDPPTRLRLNESNWPTYRGDVANTGRARADGPGADVTLRWRLATAGKVQSSPVVVDRTVYVGSTQGTLFAIDALTGKTRWTFTAPRPIHSTPAVADGVVYVGGTDRNVYALDAENGELLWTYNTGGFIKSSPTVVGETLYIGSGDGGVYALDVSGVGSGTPGVGSRVTDDQRWVFETDGWVHSTPAVVDGVVYVGSADGNVYAVDAADGTERWRFETTGPVWHSSTAVVDGTVYVGSTDDNLYALDAADGTKRWAFDAGEKVVSSPAMVDGVVYIGSTDDNLYAVDASTGEQRWRFQTGGPVGASSPAVADGVVYVGSTDHNLYALDADTGAEIGRFETKQAIWSSPAVDDRSVYVGSDDGGVYAVGESGISR